MLPLKINRKPHISPLRSSANITHISGICGKDFVFTTCLKIKFLFFFFLSLCACVCCTHHHVCTKPFDTNYVICTHTPAVCMCVYIYIFSDTQICTYSMWRCTQRQMRVFKPREISNIIMNTSCNLNTWLSTSLWKTQMGEHFRCSITHPTWGFYLLPGSTCHKMNIRIRSKGWRC